MNVSCGNCPAKYAVPDDKVRGKKVRIKCKHCGASIIVDGTRLAKDTAPAAAAKAPSPAAAAKMPEVTAPKVTAPQVTAQGAPAGGARPKAPTPAAPAKLTPFVPAPIVQPARRRSVKHTMLGVPLPAVGAAPAPPTPAPTPSPTPAAPVVHEPARHAGDPTHQTMLGGLEVPGAARVRGSARGVAQQTIVGGLEAAPGSAPAARPEQPTIPGVQSAPSRGLRVPRPGASAAPPPRPAPAPAPEPEWTVAITDEQHEEMDTREVVALFSAGTLHDETFIWKDGMEDWATPFEIPEIARELEALGLSPTTGGDDNATIVARSPLEAGSRSSGVWREPGSWNEPPVAPGADISDVRFDDVTVSMAAPRAQELLRAAEEDEAARHSHPTGRPPAMAGLSKYTDEPGPDDVTVMRAALLDDDDDDDDDARNDDDDDDDDDETMTGPSPLFSAEGELLGYPPAPGPVAGAPPVHSDTATSELDAPHPATEAAAVPRAPQPSAPGVDGQPTGARHESSVLFSLDALSKEQAPPPREPTPSTEDLFDLPPQPPASHAPAGALTAPDFNAPVSEVSSPGGPLVEAPAPPVDVEAPPRGGAGWILVLLLLAGAAYAGYYFHYPPRLWDRLLPTTGQPSPPTTTPAARAPWAAPAATHKPATAAPTPS